MALEFNTFFHFISLRTGCLIYGYLITATSLILISEVFFDREKIQEMMGVNLPKDDGVLRSVRYFALSLLIVDLLFKLLLVFGVHKNKRASVKCFFLYSVVTILYLLYAEILRMSFYRLCIRALHIYCLLVVRSYYLRMDKIKLDEDGSTKTKC